MSEQQEIILSGFCDEISLTKDINEQFSVAAALGLRHVTLRFVNINGCVKNILATNSEEREIIQDCLRAHGLKVASIGSPIGKTKLVDIDDGTGNQFRPLDEYLGMEVAQAIEVARFFDCRLLRGFSFYHPRGQRPQDFLTNSADMLRPIVERCADAGLVYGMEVEANLIGHCADTLLQLIERVNHPSLVLVFDGANLATQGYSKAEILVQWQKMLPFLGWLHLKDYSSGNARGGNSAWVDEDRLRQFVPIGMGDSGYQEVLLDLRNRLAEITARNSRLNVPGIVLDLEPHLRGGGQFGGYSGPDGFGIAMRQCCKLLDDSGLKYRLRGFDDLRVSQSNENPSPRTDH